MAIIDFKEIPQANIANGEQDIFELFAREFFHTIGFSIIQDPDRGQDGGRDIIVSEKRTGIIGDSDIKWLVSCKHKAHGGTAVNAGDEEDISDRIQAHNCNGFIGFYSTIVSAPLNRKLEALKERYEVQIFDREKIERILLENGSANKLIRRFFPKSFSEIELKSPTNLLSEYLPLRCKVCGKDLLQRDILDHYQGIVVFVQDLQYYEVGWKHKYTDIYCVCKGECDRKMEAVARA
ncbi:MAG: restriction endonuclease, partial [Fusobacterium necrophorum]|nr:restriction endonuclease [Fusobacterium necrophorum]